MPLVADIHFQPRVASLCADTFEKIRVNPGNFADGRKVWEDADTSQQNSPPAFEDNEDCKAPSLPLPLILFIPASYPAALQILHRQGPCAQESTTLSNARAA